MTAARPASEPDLRVVAGGWDGEPVPLSARRLLPPFPVDVLPGWVADHGRRRRRVHPDPAGPARLHRPRRLSAAAGGRAASRGPTRLA